MSRDQRKPKKDRTSLVISAVLHGAIIGGILIWAWKTGKIEVITNKILQVVTDDKKKEQKKPEPLQQKTQQAAPKLPPINQGAQPSASRGTRMAVASDAPSSAGGDSFFHDAREQSGGSSSGGGTGPVRQTNAVPIKPPSASAGDNKGLFNRQNQTSSVKALLQERAKASAATEAIGAEQISKSGSSDAGSAVTKIAGASIVDGKFAVIRGLSDRYVNTTLNGANLPSADPYRQSAPLDLFPSQVIDRIIVSKTFTPDQPGSFTGGGIEIVTKSFPDKNFLSLSIGSAYNSQTSLKGNFLTYAGGGKDWTGMDDGTRALPDVFSSDVPINGDPKRNPAIPPAVQGNVRTNSDNLRSDLLVDRLTRELGPTEFAPHREAAPLNQNMSIAGGGSSFMFGHPLGYFGSASYKQDYFSYENGVSRRYQGGTDLKNSFHDARSLSTVNWSTMLNLAYQPLPDHEFNFLFFYNQNAVDDVRIQDRGEDPANPGYVYRKFNLYWTERNLNTLQFKGKHLLSETVGLQFDWMVGLTTTTQDEPDAKFFNDVDTGGGNYTTENGTIPSPNKPTRYFRSLEEKNDNIRLDWTLPFRGWTVDEGKLKFGFYSSSSTRSFTERQFYYLQGFNGTGYNSDPNQFLTDATLGGTFRTNANGRTINVRFNKFIQGFDSVYDGRNDIPAEYLMLELPVVEDLRLIGGARFESTDFRVHSASYLDSSVTGTNINEARIKQDDLLPSLGVIYTLCSNMNLRVNYSQTVARPSYRELAAYYGYDPVVNEFVEGNPDLKMTAADNYDVRWEWFPRPGELLGVSIFYKDLKNAIERGNLDQQGEVITFFNNDAKLYGIEFEARKNLDFISQYLRQFSVGGNLSLLQSEVKLSPQDLQNKRAFFPNISETRALYDQSPYILNLDLNYEDRELGTSASLIFNINGPRVAFTKINTEDVYEQPAPMLDFVLSQKIGRKTTLKFSAKNLLDPEIKRTYGKNSDLLYSSYRKGLTFGLSFNYDF